MYTTHRTVGSVFQEVHRANRAGTEPRRQLSRSPRSPSAPRHRPILRYSASCCVAPEILMLLRLAGRLPTTPRKGVVGERFFYCPVWLRAILRKHWRLALVLGPSLWRETR